MEATAERTAIVLFDEILDFVLSKPNAQQVIDFELSDTLEQRLHDLLDKNGESPLNSTEQAELDEFLHVNQVFIMLKARARHKLANP